MNQDGPLLSHCTQTHTRTHYFFSLFLMGAVFVGALWPTLLLFESDLLTQSTLKSSGDKLMSEPESTDPKFRTIKLRTKFVEEWIDPQVGADKPFNSRAACVKHAVMQAGRKHAKGNQPQDGAGSE